MNPSPTLAPQPSTLNPQPPSFPARPVNGGPLDVAQPKHGDWFLEPKYNGWRALVHVPTGRMWNRHLEPLSIAGEFTAALAQLRRLNLEWLDCEALDRRHNLGRGSLIILDYLPPLTERPTYRDRRSLLALAAAFAKVPFHHRLNEPIDHNAVYLPMSYKPEAATARVEGLSLYDILKACNQALKCEFFEGVVAKRADSTYPIQRRSDKQEFPFWMKHRWAF